MYYNKPIDLFIAFNVDFQILDEPLMSELIT
jgi:hypothetical protein